MFTPIILELAREQHGVVSRRQLLDLGTSPSQITRAVKGQRLTALLSGVYVVAPVTITFHTRCMAVQLAYAGGGFLSGWTAARIAGLRRMPETPIHYTVAWHRTSRTPEWIQVHRTGWYDEDHDRHIRDDGLIVATPLRMLFGLAAAFGPQRFEKAAEDAWHLGLATPEEAVQYLERHRCRGKDGVAVMEAWLDRALPVERPAQSYFERDVIAALERAGLPAPRRQYPLRLGSGNVVHIDIAWPDIRLGLEPGHSWWHGGDSAQARDAARDLACGEQGWQIQRATEQVLDDLPAFCRSIRTIFHRRTRDIGRTSRHLRS